MPGQPKIGEREVVAALVGRNHHLIRSGQILLADKGFSGKPFQHLTEQMGLRLLRPDRRDETYTNRNLGGMRQWIESVNQTLKGQLDLEAHGARPRQGCFTRVAQRLPAMASRHLAQLDHRRDQQTIADRLRPLNITFTESTV